MITELTLIIMGQTLLGSVIIAFMFQKVKEWIGISGTLATVIAFVFGGLLGLITNIMGFVEGNLLYTILQGLISAWIATGGYDLIFKKK